MDYFTADLHERHSNILKHSKRLIFLNDYEKQIVLSGDEHAINDLRISRESTDRMNDALIDNINAIVREQHDRLWILGDFVWVRGNPHEIARTYRYYRDKIKCKYVSLIFGNHEPKVNTLARKEVAKIFSETYDMVNVVINEKRVTLCHYAMLSFDCSHHGAMHFFAHSHGSLSDWIDLNIKNHRSLDVGVDSAYRLLGEYRPFSFDEAEEIILSKGEVHNGD